jgi:hypothetical protein
MKGMTRRRMPVKIKLMALGMLRKYGETWFVAGRGLGEFT